MNNKVLNFGFIFILLFGFFQGLASNNNISLSIMSTSLVVLVLYLFDSYMNKQWFSLPIGKYFYTYTLIIGFASILMFVEQLMGSSLQFDFMILLVTLIIWLVLIIMIRRNSNTSLLKSFILFIAIYIYPVLQLVISLLFLQDIFNFAGEILNLITFGVFSILSIRFLDK